MLVPLGWLAEWIDLPDAGSLRDQLTLGGLEVDSVEHTGPDLSEIRVGLVVERAPHPGADRLSLCRVDLGEGEPVPIVCGAPNVDRGQKVAVATPGTRLPDGTKIKKSRIRGETSLGMICSSRELGLGDEHDGILVLDADASVGTSVAGLLASGETVLEIAITANRGDCASILGIAREVQAHFGGALRMPESTPAEGDRDVAEDVRVEIADPSACHRYEARVVRGVRVGPSPEWLVSRLEAVGLRSINVIVDVTNLVLMEYGQPIHAFDLAKLEGAVVCARSATAGETLITLDGEERRLEEGDLVIADVRRAVALGGVMGGANSEVTERTTDVLIESAHFHPRSVRRTARRLGIHTDASYRFERGVDRTQIARAADRAARLIAELAGGVVSRGRATAEGEAPEAVEQVRLDPAKVDRLLGTHLDREEIRAYLMRVGIDSELAPDGRLRCTVPSHRNDVERPEDLIEEVARIHGYDEIAPAVQTGELVEGRMPSTWPMGGQVRDAMLAEGLIEVLTFPFLDPADLDRMAFAEDDPRRSTTRVLNPIVERESRLRPHLGPALLRLVRENRNRQVDRVAIFEVARTYVHVKTGELPEERLWLTAVLTPGEERRLWDPRDPSPLFFQIKGITERLLQRLRRGGVLGAGADEPYLHPGASATIGVGKHGVGKLGELHPDVAAAFEIDAPTALLEVDLTALEASAAAPPAYDEVSRHPRVKRDLAVVVDRDKAAGEILEAIRKQAGGSLLSVDVFDRYEGKGVAEGKVSLAFRLVFQRVDRTLTDAEVARSVDRVVQMLAHRFGGELR